MEDEYNYSPSQAKKNHLEYHGPKASYVWKSKCCQKCYAHGTNNCNLFTHTHCLHESGFEETRAVKYLQYNGEGSLITGDPAGRRLASNGGHALSSKRWLRAREILCFHTRFNTIFSALTSRTHTLLQRRASSIASASFRDLFYGYFRGLRDEDISILQSAG